MARTIFLRVSPLQVIVIVVVLCLALYFLIPPLFQAALGGGGGGVRGRGGFGGFRGSSKHLKTVREKAMSWSEDGRRFVIGGKSTILVSGAIHYFRVPPRYWEDRLAKLAAAGLNTLETYMPWNLHEPRPGVFDFTGRLDVHRFIKMAQRFGLHVILRPGPYICSEWDFGGLPAWLLHDPSMIVRSTYPAYLEAVRSYMVKVGEVVGDLQYSYGGPIIAVQIENEYASYEDGKTEESRTYMKYLYDLFKTVGFREQLFTSDGQDTMESAVRLRPHEDVLLTVNFMHDRVGLDQLEELQPHRPKMVMEFWTGWFDHWGGEHVPRKHPAEEIESKTTAMLERGVSVNYYMFHGGTNFGFMNGANWMGDQSYNAVITSYDYDAPLAENGDITPKYHAIRKAIRQYRSQLKEDDNAEAQEQATFSVSMAVPPNIPSASYGDVKLTLYLSILSTLQYLPEPHTSQKPVPMELLPLHGCGQGYGFILYRTIIPTNSKAVTVSEVRDFGIAMVEGVPVHVMSMFQTQKFLISPSVNIQNEGKDGIQLDLLVENAGRVNFGQPLENRKGILGNVMVDDREVTGWKIYSLEFDSEFVQQISEGGMWQRTPPSMPNPGPALYKGTFNIEGEPKDTFINIKGWSKGVLFVNGANLGRYWDRGPQQTLYVPAPVLRRGVNQVVVFETRMPKKPQLLTFTDSPILDHLDFN